MTAGVPLEEAVEVFNAVAEASAENPDKLAQLEWKAMKAVRQSPASFTARVSHAAVLICTGQREEGLAELQVAHNLSAQGQVVEKDMFASLCYFTGDYDRACEIYNNIMSTPDAKQFSAVAAKATICAILAGATDMLKRLMDNDEPLALETYKILCDSEMLEYFSAHQAIVHGIIAASQCRADAAVIADVGESPLVSMRYFVLGNRAARSKLSREIHDALEEFYRSRGVPSSFYVGKIQTSILPAPKNIGASVAA